MKTVFALLVLVALVAGGGVYYVKFVAIEVPVSFRPAEVKRGDLLPTISATGTLEPEEVVDVGAQVAGRLEKLGPDLSDPTGKKTVDYRSVVKENQLLAQIDDTMYKAQLEQAAALLERSKADLLQLKAKRDQAERDWARVENLHAAKAISESDYDLYNANNETAKANVTVGEATINQNEAALKMADANLKYTVIKSPVDGEIIARRVNVGQTVVASLNAPSLFLIAKDLRRIQVWAPVNEADIGRIHKDMPVRFTVDAYPGETFRGKVLQIRLNATMTQNVVTYTVVVQTDNVDGKLLPYLTANLQFELEDHKDVLQVPNAALRWKPTRLQIAPDVRDAVSRELSGKKGRKGGSGEAKAGGDTPAAAAAAAKSRDDRGRLWVKDEDGDHVRPLDVKVGVTDGSVTEVSADNLKEGMEVVIGEVAANQDSGDVTNPFAPKLFRGGKVR